MMTSPLKFKKIHVKYLPPRLPVQSTALWWLVLDHFQAPGWLWGGMGAMFIVVWIGSIYSLLASTYLPPVFGEKE
jgi:hypothetical protein